MTYIHYRVIPLSPEAHLFEIQLTLRHPHPEGQLLRLPTWIPGSYKIRDFAKHIVDWRVATEMGVLSAEKIDNHTWQVERCQGPWTMTYRVYAWDLSVRTAHLDQNHGFFIRLRYKSEEHY